MLIANTASSNKKVAWRILPPAASFPAGIVRHITIHSESSESVTIHRLLSGSSFPLSLVMVEPCKFSPAEPVDCYGFNSGTRLSRLDLKMKMRAGGVLIYKM